MFILVVVLSVTAAILAYLPIPFLWIALLWGGMLCILAIKHKSPSLRAVWINLAVVIITLGALELYLHSRETERMAGSYTEIRCFPWYVIQIDPFTCARRWTA